MPRLIVNNKNLIIPASKVYPYSSWTNSTWTTFSSSGLNITGATYTSETGIAYATTSFVPFNVGDKLYWKYYLTKNSGVDPGFRIVRQEAGAVADGTVSITGNGVEYSYTFTTAGNYHFWFSNRGAGATDVDECLWEIYSAKIPLSFLTI